MEHLQRRCLAWAVGLFTALPLCGQYGSLVPTFNPLDDGQYGDGVMQYHATYSPPSGMVSSILERQNGHVLIAGNYRTYNGEASDGITQLLPDGRIDPSFSLALPVGFAPVTRFIELSHGRLLLVGRAPSTGFLIPYAIKRFLPNGGLDGGFTAVANTTVTALLELPDGRVLVAGQFTAINGAPAGRIARLLADGTVDPTFSIGIGANNEVLALALDADGGILIGGRFTMIDGVPRRGLARLSPDGVLDPAFDPMVAATSSSVVVNTIQVDAEGRSLIGGAFVLGGQPEVANLVRVLSDGSLDESFVMNAGPNGTVRAMAVQGDGRVVIGGSFTQMGVQPCSGLAALYADGQLDEEFAADLGHEYGAEVQCIAGTASGDLLIGGRFSNVEGRFRLGITRLLANGSLALGFNPGRGVGGLINAMAMMPDGRIAIAGNFISYNDHPRPYLAFLTSDGELHPAFNGGSGPDGPIDLLVALPDGRLFIAGRFSAYNGVEVPRMAVVDAFGALDQAVAFPFPAPSLEMRFTAALALDDGSVVVALAPELQTYGSTTLLVRYLPDGSQSTSFDPPAPIYGRIYAMARGLNGSIVLGGSHRLGSMSAPLGISRLLPSGSIDHTFGVGNGIGPAEGSSVMALAQLPDGRLIIGGTFNNYRNGVARGIACLNADGTRCSGFSTQGITSGFVEQPAILSIAPLADGRLVLAGWFNTYDGAPHRSVAICLPDGSQDPSFSSGEGPAYPSLPYVRQVLLTPQGHYLVSGLFHRFDGQARHRIALLSGGGGVGIGEVPSSAGMPTIWPNPVTDHLFSASPITGAVLNTLGETVHTFSGSTVIDVGRLAPGQYIIRTVDGASHRFIKH